MNLAQLCILVVCGANFLRLSTLAATPPYTENLIAYYRFDGSLSDSSPSGFHATGTPSGFDADRYGMPSGAVFFAGGNYAALPQKLVSSLSGSGPLSVTAWVKVKDLSILQNASRNIVAFGDASAGAGLTFGLSSLGPGKVEYSSFINDGLFSGGAIAADSWVQIGLTIDALGNVALYKNGVADGAKSGTSPRRGSGAGYIGRGFDNTTWTGLLDDLRIFGRDLLPKEMKALFEYESQSPTGAATASATAQVVNGFVVGVNVQYGGAGYVTAPAVQIVGGGGSGATAVATVVDGVVTAIKVVTTGSGYSLEPEVRIDPPPTPPRKATAVAQIANGFLVGVAVTDRGAGYTETPVVVISGGGGNGALAEAVVEGGMVTSIRVVATGGGYTTAPVVIIGRPPEAPEIGITVSRVVVNLRLVLGKTYLLESSADLATWNPVGAAFTAVQEDVQQEFSVAQTGRYFRIQQLP